METERDRKTERERIKYRDSETERDQGERQTDQETGRKADGDERRVDCASQRLAHSTNFSLASCRSTECDF